MGATERVVQYIEYKGVTKYAFCKKMGFSNKFLDNSSNMGTDKACKILRQYPEINSDWLLTGKGEMLNVEHPQVVPTDSLGGLPLIDVSVAAGFGSADFAVEQSDIIARYHIPDFEGKADLMTYVRGDSMVPSYKSGDIVVCKRIIESSFIQWNEVHIVATIEQGLLIKRVKPGGVKNTLTLVSDNQEYPPFEIPKSEVTGMALVLGSIRFE